MAQTNKQVGLAAVSFLKKLSFWRSTPAVLLSNYDAFWKFVCSRSAVMLGQDSYGFARKREVVLTFEVGASVIQALGAHFNKVVCRRRLRHFTRTAYDDELSSQFTPANVYTEHSTATLVDSTVVSSPWLRIGLQSLRWFTKNDFQLAIRALIGCEPIAFPPGPELPRIIQEAMVFQISLPTNQEFDLPPEIWGEITSYLNEMDLMTAMQVSRSMYWILDEQRTTKIAKLPRLYTQPNADGFINNNLRLLQCWKHKWVRSAFIDLERRTKLQCRAIAFSLDGLTNLRRLTFSVSNDEARYKLAFAVVSWIVTVPVEKLSLVGVPINSLGQLLKAFEHGYICPDVTHVKLRLDIGFARFHFVTTMTTVRRLLPRLNKIAITFWRRGNFISERVVVQFEPMVVFLDVSLDSLQWLIFHIPPDVQQLTLSLNSKMTMLMKVANLPRLQDLRFRFRLPLVEVNSIASFADHFSGLRNILISGESIDRQLINSLQTRLPHLTVAVEE